MKAKTNISIISSVLLEFIIFVLFVVVSGHLKIYWNHLKVMEWKSVKLPRHENIFKFRKFAVKKPYSGNYMFTHKDVLYMWEDLKKYPVSSSLTRKSSTENLIHFVNFYSVLSKDPNDKNDYFFTNPPLVWEIGRKLQGEGDVIDNGLQPFYSKYTMLSILTGQGLQIDRSVNHQRRRRSALLRGNYGSHRKPMLENGRKNAGKNFFDKSVIAVYDFPTTTAEPETTITYKTTEAPPPIICFGLEKNCRLRQRYNYRKDRLNLRQPTKLCFGLQRNCVVKTVFIDRNGKISYTTPKPLTAKLLSLDPFIKKKKRRRPKHRIKAKDSYKMQLVEDETPDAEDAPKVHEGASSNESVKTTAACVTSSVAESKVAGGSHPDLPKKTIQ